jgi:hypothetical protein
MRDGVRKGKARAKPLTGTVPREPSSAGALLQKSLEL